MMQSKIVQKNNGVYLKFFGNLIPSSVWRSLTPDFLLYAQFYQ